MGKIDELIKQMCPEGVKLVTLVDVGEFYSGLSGKSKDDFKDGNAKFITYVNIYNNPSLEIDVEERVKIAEGEKQNTIQYGDLLFTGSSETPDECGMCSVLEKHTDEKLYLNSFCFGFRFHDLSDKCPAFMKHLFRSRKIRKAIGRTANGVTRYNVSKKDFGRIQIPIPPIEVQQSIAEILDKFDRLSAELQAELQARKTQYEYYRNQLLTRFAPDQQVKEYSLGELCEIGTGSHNTQDGLQEGDFPFYTRGIDILRLNSYDYDETAVITAGDGAGVGKVIHFVKGKYALHQRAYRLVADETKLLPKYLYYYMHATFYDYIMRSSVSSSVTSIRKPMLFECPIMLPSLAEQARIVSILDKFEALVNDLSQGLPAEIEAVRDQYEYYRNKLLTF